MTIETQTLSKREIIDAFAKKLEKTDLELQAVQENSNKIHHKTTQVIRLVFMSIGFMLFINLYFIYDFGKGVVIMLDSMEQMYTHFGEVTAEVDTMTHSVVNMSKDIETLPEMLNKMDSMNQTVQVMNEQVQGMNDEVGQMKNDVGKINQNMQNMSHRFEQVNGNVSRIGYSVNQMSRTIP